MAPILAVAEALAAELVGFGISAVVDVTTAVANLPCVLIPPPTLDFVSQPDGSPTARWQLVAIAADSSGTRTSWEQLDALVTSVAELLPVERAEPISYTLPTGGDPLPAYAITLTGSITLTED